MSEENDTLPIIDSFGNVRRITPEEFPLAQQKYGAQIIPEERWKSHLEKKEYGDKDFQAALFGTLRGLSFGGSDALARMLGGESAAGHLEKLEKYNPKISTVSNIAGALAPIILSGGAAAPEEIAGEGLAKAATGLAAEEATNTVGPLAKLASQFPTSMMSRAGQGTIKALEESSPLKALATKGTLGKALATGLAEAGGYGVESVPYGMGHALSEDMLGDPDLNATKLLGHMTVDGLFTGAFGAGMGSIIGPSKVFATPLIKSASEKIGGISDWLKEFPQSGAEAAIPKMGLSPEEEKMLNPLIYSAEARKKAFMSNIEGEELYKKQTSALNDAESDIRKIKFGVENVRSNYNKTLGSAVAEDRMRGGANTILSKADAQLTAMKGDISYDAPLLNDFEKILRRTRDVVNNPDSTMGEVYEEMRKFNQDFGKDILFQRGNLTRVETNAIKELRPLYKDNTEFLTNANVWGEPFSAQADITSKYSDFLQNKVTQKVAKDWGKIARDSNGRVIGIDFAPNKVAARMKDMYSAKGQEAFNNLNRYFDFAADLLDVGKNMADKVPTKSFNPDEAYNQLGHKVMQTTEGFGDASPKAALKGIKSIPFPEAKFSMGNMVKRGLSLIPGVGKYAENMPIGETTPYGWVQRLQLMDRRLGDIDKKMDSWFQRFVNGENLSKAESLARRVAVPLGVPAEEALFHHGMIHGLLDSIDRNGEDLQERLEPILALANDPNRAQQIMAANLQHMSGFAPNTSAALAAKGVGALTLLAQNAPKDQRSPLEKILNPKAPKYSDAELHQFKSLLQSIQNPLNPMANMMKGKTSAQDKQVMRQLYGSLLKHQQDRFLNKVIETGKPLKYKERINAGRYFGLNTDRSLSQGMGQIAPPRPQSPPQVKQKKPTQTGLNKLTFPSRKATHSNSLFKD